MRESFTRFRRYKEGNNALGILGQAKETWPLRRKERREEGKKGLFVEMGTLNGFFLGR